MHGLIFASRRKTSPPAGQIVAVIAIFYSAGHRYMLFPFEII